MLRFESGTDRHDLSTAAHAHFWRYSDKDGSNAPRPDRALSIEWRLKDEPSLTSYSVMGCLP
jgi:hypothetical protein